MTSESSSIILNARAEIYIYFSIFVTLVTFSLSWSDWSTITYLISYFFAIILAPHAIKNRDSGGLLPFIISQFTVVILLFKRVIIFLVIDEQISFKNSQLTLPGYYLFMSTSVLFGFGCYFWTVIFSFYLQFRSEKSPKLPVDTKSPKLPVGNNVNISSAAALTTV